MRVEAVLRRIDAVELRMRTLQQELSELRALVASGRVEGVVPEPVPSAAPVPVQESDLKITLQQTVAKSAEAAVAVPREHPAIKAARREPRRAIDWEELLGARALAWAGGVVTLLGVVFLFVLAVNRGWIGPGERVLLGVVASLLVFGAGIEVHRRYGQLYAALGAVGAGIAGAYATLLAATALYELIPPYAALPVAMGIGTVGVAVAMWWSAEMIAGLGLIGAMLSPVAIAVDDGVTALGTFFAAVVLAATAVVTVARRWDRVLAVGAAVSAIEAGFLMIDAWGDSSGRAVAVVASFWLLYVATGVALHLRDRTAAPRPLVTTFLVGSATFAVAGAMSLLDGEVWGVSREGGVLLAGAVIYGAVAAWLFREWREVSAVVAALGLTLCAIGLAFVLGGPALTIAWAAEAALLAWLAQRLGETRFQIGAVAYLGLAIAHALTFEAQPRLLFEEVAHPGREAYSLLAIAAGAGVFAWYARSWPAPAIDDEKASRLARWTAWFASARREWRWAALAVLPAALLYAAALGLLELHVGLGGGDAWAWGHVSIAALWGAVGAAALFVGGRLRRIELEVGGLAVMGLGLTMLTVEGLGDDPRGFVALALAAAVLAGCAAHRLLPAQSDAAIGSLVGIAASAALAAYAATTLLSDQAEGAALVGAGAVYGLLAASAVVRAERDGATMLWGLGIVLAFAGSPELLDGNWLVLAWSAAAGALGWLAARIEERRLQVAAVTLVAVAGGFALATLAQPIDFLRENSTPAEGAPAIAFVVLALAALVAASRPFAAPPRDALDAAVDELRERGRRVALWTLGVLAVYSGSLAVLGAFQLSDTSVATAFQRGHTAVSAMWGAIGLALLYAGLRRGGRSLRLAGFALLGISLAKIFLYDLSTLSSVARALSFLAVGAVFLLGAFFYQRLSTRPDTPSEA